MTILWDSTEFRNSHQHFLGKKKTKVRTSNVKGNESRVNQCKNKIWRSSKHIWPEKGSEEPRWWGKEDEGVGAELRGENLLQTVCAESQPSLAFHGELCVHAQMLLAQLMGSTTYLCGIFPREKYLFCHWFSQKNEGRSFLCDGSEQGSRAEDAHTRETPNLILKDLCLRKVKPGKD